MLSSSLRLQYYEKVGETPLRVVYFIDFFESMGRGKAVLIRGAVLRDVLKIEVSATLLLLEGGVPDRGRW